MDLSICILTHNQPALLPKCVVACLAEIDASRVGGEIIIIDNASVERYPERLASTDPRVRVIRNEQNLSFSAGNNIGIRASRGEYVLILNDDAILQPGSLNALLQVLKCDPSIGAVGPKILNPDGTAQKGSMHNRLPHVRGIILCLLRLNSIFESYEWTRRLLTLARNPEISGETEQVVGACMLVRCDALVAAGLFDERFHYLLEDDDLCNQMRRRGWRIFYASETTIVHYGSASLRAWSRSEFFSTFVASVVYYFKKDSSLWQYFLLRGLLVPLVFCRMCWLFVRDLTSRRKCAPALRGHLGVLRFLLGRQRRRKIEEPFAG